MDSLRIILLICGVVLLAGIYVWGVTVARRSSRSDKHGDPAAELDKEVELLERFQDSRAAHNAESLKELNEIDIDAELDRSTPSGTAAESAAASANETVESTTPTADDDHDEGKFRPVFAEDVRQSTAGNDEVGEKHDLVASLAEIRATLAPHPVMKVDQLELLPEEKELQREREKRDEAKTRLPGKKTSTPESLVLSVTVMAKEGRRFPGEELRNWLEALKLRHGDMGIFHYRPPGKPMRAPPTFSVASVVKPGSFDIEQLEDISIPGVAMFVQLPGPDDPAAAFEEMLRTARKLADGLDGTVCDETRSTLTGQAINHMRERIAEFSRRQRLRF